jgi:hypothetical protein
MAFADQLKAQALQLQAQAMEQAAVFSRTSGADSVPAAGSMGWARQVMAVLAPPGPGFVKRCTCVTCGAAKKLPTVTAYVYCDYCASLIDYDLRRACEGHRSQPRLRRCGEQRTCRLSGSGGGG